ncbi:MAG: glycosyltransferase family 2 protein [Balneolaceae bacterium]|nr:glycosyltransferase family 2 protein [Balneolaceae bacterium]
MSRSKFTIILPTTGKRGPLLPYSIGSIQNQTIQDFEVFIIGDGISDETRELIEGMMDKDSRIRLFDHPKHERRGEPYRHKALQEANSDFVCYLCDRDMMLPNHLEVLAELLATYNFASTTYIDVKEDGRLSMGQYIGYYGKASDHKAAARGGGISLSNVGHTLDLYHQLPHGWRTTPKDQFTDVYMWQQFNGHPECIAYSDVKPTIIYFKRGHFPGASVNDRKRDLEKWSKKIINPDDINDIKKKAIGGLLMEKNDLKWFMLKMYKSPISIRGHTIKEAFIKLFKKISVFR